MTERCNCASEDRRIAELDDLIPEAQGSIHYSEWQKQPCPVHDNGSGSESQLEQAEGVLRRYADQPRGGPLSLGPDPALAYFEKRGD